MSVEGDVAPTPRVRSTRQWMWILGSIGVFVFALVVGVRVIGTLMGVLSPPMPPLPQSSAEAARSTDTYGRERWVYLATSFPDSVVAFYQGMGAECEIAPFPPERERELWSEFPDAATLEAYCTGGERFDRFTMDWQVLVNTIPGDTRSRLDVVRQINWFESDP